MPSICQVTLTWANHRTGWGRSQGWATRTGVQEPWWGSGCGTGREEEEAWWHLHTIFKDTCQGCSFVAVWFTFVSSLDTEFREGRCHEWFAQQSIPLHPSTVLKVFNLRIPSHSWKLVRTPKSLCFYWLDLRIRVLHWGPFGYICRHFWLSQLVGVREVTLASSVSSQRCY